MEVDILGTEYECRALGPHERLRWNAYLSYECERTFYSDLFATLEDLPEHVQDAVMAKRSPPKRLKPSMPLYYRLASNPKAVRFLLDLLITGEPPEVTDDNAAGILLAVRDLIFGMGDPKLHDTPEKQEAALKTFETLEADNGG